VTNQNQVLEYIQKINTKLSQQGHHNIKNEIIWYLESLNMLTATVLYTGSIDLTDELKHIIHNFYLLKQQNLPLQYIMNQASFFGRDFYINQNVLIPRPETETIIRYLKDKKYNTGLEIGIGSGIISITLLLEKIVQSVVATDISSEAIDVCKKNIQLFKITNIVLQQHDILKESLTGQYDIIISNPPYISLEEYNLLPKHIKKYEPPYALTDYYDGLTFYKRFIYIIKENLNDNGVFICELGLSSTYQATKNIFLNHGFSTKTIRDLNNDPRILVVTHHDEKN